MPGQKHTWKFIVEKIPHKKFLVEDGLIMIQSAGVELVGPEDTSISPHNFWSITVLTYVIDPISIAV